MTTAGQHLLRVRVVLEEQQIVIGETDEAKVALFERAAVAVMSCHSYLLIPGRSDPNRQDKAIARAEMSGRTFAASTHGSPRPP